MSEQTQLEWCILIGFWMAALFPIYIRPFWRWNESWWGRNIISLDISVAITFFPSWADILFPAEVQAHLRLWRGIELVGIYLVLVNLVWRTVLIIYTQVSYNKRTKARDIAEAKPVEPVEPVEPVDPQ